MKVNSHHIAELLIHLMFGKTEKAVQSQLASHHSLADILERRLTWSPITGQADLDYNENHIHTRSKICVRALSGTYPPVYHPGIQEYHLGIVPRVDVLDVSDCSEESCRSHLQVNVFTFQ